MASKNLGAVIQRAISDGAFRRQLQSDPAAALRGFNLTPDEIAAVRSGDSSRLMTLGVDQRMSKAFTLGGAGAAQPTRAAMSDVSGGSSSVLAGDNTSGAREGLVGDPTAGARAASSDGQTSGTREMTSEGEYSGTRATLTDGQTSGTSSSVATPQADSYRAINDPDSSGSSRATISDPTAGGVRSTLTGGQADSYRAINDPDNAGTTRESVAAPQADSYRAINDPDNDSVASRMHDANVGLPGGDARLDPGFVDSHSAFIPADSADVQRELLDGEHHGTGDALGQTGDAAGDARLDPGSVDSHGTGDALGHTGDTGDEHSWG